MRWPALAVVLGACNFERPSAPSGVDAPMTPDAPDIDAPMMVVCPPSYAAKHDGHSYRLTDRDYTWAQARDFCAMTGGHLVKIETQAEDEFIADAIDGIIHPFVWTGLHDPAQNNILLWADGTPLDGFEHFEGGEPSEATGKDCVDKDTTDVDGRWFAFNCESVKRGVCECDG